MSIIDVQGLTFGYDGSSELVFENTSFRLDSSWRLGFTGRNGRGKTTFLRILNGELDYKGRIIASMNFEYFPYPVNDTRLTCNELARKVCPDFEEWELLIELSRLSLDPSVLERSFSTLSHGERTKLLLAVLFLKPNAFFLIDEPTNHLDSQARRVTAEWLAGKQGFILVSHDRDFLDACTDHTLSINRSGIEITQGSFSVWYENKQNRDAFELAKNSELKREISRLRSTAHEKSSWSEVSEGRKIGFDPSKTEKSTGRRAFEGAKSKKMQSRAKAIEKRAEAKLEEKSSLLKDIEEVENLKLNPLVWRSERLFMLEAVGVSVGSREILRGLDFTMNRGERVCISGLNGSGKSTLLKLIVGKLGSEYSTSGRFTLPNGLKVSYLEQDVISLSGSLADFEQGCDRVLFRAILRKLGFSRELFELPLEAYSLGQKKKCALAYSLATPAHLYVWDEPLNYIDIYSRMQIERLLVESDAAVIFVEHDAAFRRECSHRELTLTKPE